MIGNTPPPNSPKHEIDRVESASPSSPSAKRRRIASSSGSASTFPVVGQNLTDAAPSRIGAAASSELSFDGEDEIVQGVKDLAKNIQGQVDAAINSNRSVFQQWNTEYNQRSSLNVVSRTNLGEVGKHLTQQYGDQSFYDFYSQKIVGYLSSTLGTQNKNYESILCEAVAFRYLLAEKSGTQNAKDFSTIRNDTESDLESKEMVTPLGPIYYETSGLVDSDSKYGRYLDEMLNRLNLDKEACKNKDEYSEVVCTYSSQHGQYDIDLSTLKYDTTECGPYDESSGLFCTLSDSEGNYIGGLSDYQTDAASFSSAIDELDGELSIVKNISNTSAKDDQDRAIEASQRIAFLTAHAAFTNRGGSSVAEWLGAASLSSLTSNLRPKETLAIEKSVYQKGLAAKDPEACIEEMSREAKNLIASKDH